jgi:glycosyltransferase involved in cell wall biosynthesis
MILGMPDAFSISGCIICKNQVARIGLALDSLAWCDEIVVVDSGSTDGTVELCRRHPSGKVRVMHQDWLGFNGQREFAVRQCRNDWVLMLDADEECSSELGEELRGLSRETLAKAGLFAMPRKNHIAQRHVRCWGPDYQTRFGHKERIAWSPVPIPEHREAKAGFELRKLKGALLHNRLTPYSPEDLCDGRRMQEYGILLAQALREKGTRPTFFNLWFRPFFTFVKYYVFKGGFLDGRFGLVIAYKTLIGSMLKFSVLFGDEAFADQRPGARAEKERVREEARTPAEEEVGT